MIIVGAGMAGLLAARMLAKYSPTVIERQEGLPNNHSAVLRFRTGEVGVKLGIPFKRVTMIKDIVPWMNPVADAMAYAKKNGNQYRSDRSITDEQGKFERYIAPPNLIAQMAGEVEGIRYGVNFDFGSVKDDEPIISTIPMPVLGQALRYPVPLSFRYSSGTTIRAKIANCDAYSSLAIPSPRHEFSRISITGGDLIVEVPNVAPANLRAKHRDMVGEAASLFGINVQDILDIGEPRWQAYNKLVPIEDDERKQFIYWASDEHNVFSLGRYATWRPRLLLDDLIQDIEWIEKWIVKRDRYSLAKHRS